MTRRPRGSLANTFRCALAGIALVLQEERNGRIHLAAAVLVVALAAWLGLSPVEWALLVFAIALVMVGEMLNTVIERTIDLVTLDDHPLARCAKDVAAGAILLASIAAAIIGLLILGPPLWERIAQTTAAGNALLRGDVQ